MRIMISIIIPTLNEEDFLPGLLRSIKKQTFKDFELIVADAGSKDKTVEIAKKYGCLVVGGGRPAKGRNEGAKLAKGDLLLFLDADTKLPSKNFLKKILKEFKERKLDIASGFVQPMGESRFFSPKTVKFAFDFVNYFIQFNENILPAGIGSIVLVKKDFHFKIRGFNENVDLGEDALYFKKGAKRGKFGNLRSGKILWSIRRLEKEKWLRVVFSYILCGFLSSFGERYLKIFKKGFLKYHWAHYKDVEPTKDFLDSKKLKEFLNSLISKTFK